MMRLPRATSMPFSAASLRAMRSTQRAAARRRPGIRASTTARAPIASGRHRRWRRTVVHDALPERNRARHLTDDPPMTGMIGAWTLSMRVAALSVSVHVVWNGRLAYSSVVTAPRVPARRVPCAALAAAGGTRPAAAPVAAGAIPIARTVYRVPRRRGQQARAVGQDPRLHEDGRGAARTASASASSAKPAGGNPFVVLEISSPDTTQESRSLQAARARAVLPGRGAGRPRARRDLPPRQGRRGRHVQRARERGRRDADVDGARAPARDRRLAGGEEDPRQRDLPARAERESRRRDLVDRLVQHRISERRTRRARCPTSTTRTPGHDINRDMYMFTQKESQYMAQLMWHDWLPTVWLDEHQMGIERSAYVRDAGRRPDQPERASAHLPVERHPRPVASGGARSGGQGRHHLQLHVHELLGRRDGVEQLVAQPDRPAHGSRERACRLANRSAARHRRPRTLAAATRRAWGRRRSSSRACCRHRSTSRHARNIRAPGLAVTGRSATSWTTSSSRRCRCSKQSPIGGRRCSARSTR